MSVVDDVVKSAQNAEQEKNWTEAASLYKRAADMSQGIPASNWRYRQGLSLERAKRFDEAIEVYQVALQTQPRGDWWHRVGVSAEGAKKYALSKEAFFKSLELNETTTNVEKALVHNSPKAFPARLKILDWLRKKLPIIKARVDANKWKHEGPPKIFTYWDSGLDRAPAVVKPCHRELKRFHNSSEVHVLTADTWQYYVELPAHVLAKLPTNRAHFSDVLRVALLSRYGGIWADATCMFSQNVTGQFDELTSSGFFSFQVNGPRISNWFLCSSGDNYIPKMMFETLSEYWSEHDDVTHYFMFHHMFEILYYLDARFKKIWDSMKKKNSQQPHELQFSMFAKYEKEKFQQHYQSAFIHKLTYKYGDKIPKPDLVIGHIFRGDF